MQEPGAGKWTFHALVAEQDRQLQGKITAHLTLEHNRLVGSVTNTLDVSLNDVFVLLPHSFIALGHLAAAQQSSISSLTLAEPNAIYDLIHKTHPGVIGDLVQASLFNWQTMAWDRITLFSGSLTTTNTTAYIGPGGRVLLQVANEDPSGLLLFAKPSLSLKDIS